MPKLVSVGMWGRNGVPFGRLAEARPLVAHPERTAMRHGRALGSDTTFHEWRTREAMAREIRKHERSQPASEFTPMIPLGTTEGY